MILPDGTGTPFNMLLHFEDQPEGLDVLGIVEWSELLPDKVIPVRRRSRRQLLLFRLPGVRYRPFSGFLAP